MTKVDMVYGKIKARIESGAFPVGYSALEPELALRFHVSRTPVREALVRLQAENLIVLTPRHGMMVL